MGMRYKIIDVKILSATRVIVTVQLRTSKGNTNTVTMDLTLAGATLAAKKLEVHQKLCAAVSAMEAQENPSAPAATPVDDIVNKEIDATITGTVTEIV